MKKNAVALLLILCTAVATGTPKAIYYVHTGMALPLSPTFVKDAYTQGFNVGVMVGMRFNPRFELQGAFDLNNCAFDNQGFSGTLNEIQAWKKKYPNTEPTYNVDGNSANAWNLFVNAKLIFPPKEGGKVESYFFAGGGVFGLKQGQISVTDSEIPAEEVFPGNAKNIPAKSETVLGANFGIGIDVLLEEHTNFYVQLGPTIGFTKGDPTVIVPITFGVSIRP
jgi:hypothetical protein